MSESLGVIIQLSAVNECRQAAQITVHKDRSPFFPTISVSFDTMVERILFDWFATCFANHLLNLVNAQNFRRCGSGIVIDQFVADGSVQIVGSVCKRQRAVPSPSMIQYALIWSKLSSINRLTAITRRSTRLDGLGICASLVFSGWNANGMKVWNPPVSSCNFVCWNEVIDPVVRVFNMTVEHRGVRAQTHLMRGSVNLEQASSHRTYVRRSRRVLPDGKFRHCHLEA